jgi:biopolymer transport protein ExbD
MKLKTGYEKRKARVEMLPLIDVVFLLLVFFIYAMVSMVVHRGLAVELPAAGTAAVDTREYLSITLTADQEIFVDGEPVAPADVAQRVQHVLLTKAPECPVYIDGDRQAGLGSAVELLDRLRRAGIRKVSFTCSKPEK